MHGGYQFAQRVGAQERVHVKRRGFHSLVYGWGGTAKALVWLLVLKRQVTPMV